MDKKKQVVEALTILSQHPLIKSKKITPGQIKEWIIATDKVDPGRIAWHSKRTFKIGGSDIFTPVAFLRAVKASSVHEHYSAFTMTSVQDLVKSKLLVKFPSEPDMHMRRGILSEPLAREVFIKGLRKRGHIVEFDTEASEALKTLKVFEHPWVAYNEDDVLLIDGERVLVDYKCPAPDPIKGLDLSVEEAYVHQLHLGAFALSYVGFPASKLKLVKYNVVEASVIPIDVELSERIISENLEAGDYLYENYILKNRIPEYQPQVLAQLTLSDIRASLESKFIDLPGVPESALESLMVAANQFALAKSLAASASDSANSLMKQVKDSIKTMDVQPDESTLTVGPVEIKLETTLVLDEDAIISEAIKLGVELRNYEKSVKYDIDALYKEVKTQAPGFSAEEKVPTSSVVVTRKTKGVIADHKSLVKNMSEQLVEAAISGVPKTIKQIKLIDEMVGSEVKNNESKRRYFADRWELEIERFISTQSSNEQKSEIGIFDELEIDSHYVLNNQPF